MEQTGKKVERRDVVKSGGIAIAALLATAGCKKAVAAKNAVAPKSKFGMVIDFSDLKKIVMGEIVDQFDHATVFNKNTPNGIAIR